jgi:hypothetical protein
MKVVSYLSGIPVKNNKFEKSACLEFFVKGVNLKGDTGICTKNFNIIPCDLAMIQGFVHEGSKNMPHLRLRKQVLETQKLNNSKTLIADSNLFLYLNKENTPHHYLRYSFDGIFRSTGFYFDKDIDKKKWQQIKHDLQIDVKPYRKTGNHILVCLQRDNGWSMHGTQVKSFLESILSTLKIYTDRPIIVRGHPGDKKTSSRMKQYFPTVQFSNEPRLENDLRRAWATVTFNSSPGVASLIEGVPVFQIDPNIDNSMYGEVANKRLQQIEQPILFDRTRWLEKISMCHWKFDELQNGSAWAFMKQYL